LRPWTPRQPATTSTAGLPGRVGPRASRTDGSPDGMPPVPMERPTRGGYVPKRLVHFGFQADAARRFEDDRSEAARRAACRDSCRADARHSSSRRKLRFRPPSLTMLPECASRRRNASPNPRSPLAQAGPASVTRPRWPVSTPCPRVGPRTCQAVPAQSGGPRFRSPGETGQKVPRGPMWAWDNPLSRLVGSTHSVPNTRQRLLRPRWNGIDSAMCV
jgi:hypothetical protein